MTEEAIGLPNPVFDNGTFILKTTVRSAEFQKLPFDKAEVAVLGQKLPIDKVKAADSERIGKQTSCSRLSDENI